MIWTYPQILGDGFSLWQILHPALLHAAFWCFLCFSPTGLHWNHSKFKSYQSTNPVFSVLNILNLRFNFHIFSCFFSSLWHLWWFTIVSALFQRHPTGWLASCSTSSSPDRTAWLSLARSDSAVKAVAAVARRCLSLDNRPRRPWKTMGKQWENNGKT